MTFQDQPRGPSQNFLGQPTLGQPPPAPPPTLPAQTMDPAVAQQFFPFLPDAAPRGQFVQQFNPRPPDMWGQEPTALTGLTAMPGTAGLAQKLGTPGASDIPGIMHQIGGALGRFGSFNVGRNAIGMMGSYSAFLKGLMNGRLMAAKLAQGQTQQYLDNLILTQRTELLHAGEIQQTFPDPNDPRRHAAMEQLARQNNDPYLLNALAQGEDQAEKVLQWRDSWLQTLQRASATSKKADEASDLGDFGTGGGAGAAGTGHFQAGAGATTGGTAAGTAQIGPDGQFIAQPAQTMGAGAAAGGVAGADSAGAAGQPGAGQGGQTAQAPAGAAAVGGAQAAGAARQPQWTAQPIGQTGVPVDPTGVHPALTLPAGGSPNYNTPVFNRAKQRFPNLSANGIQNIDSEAQNVQMEPSTNLSRYPKAVQEMITARASEMDSQLNAILRGPLRGQRALDAIANINPLLARNLYNYIEGKVQPPGTWTSGRMPWSMISGLAANIDPSFNTNVWDTRAKTLHDFTSGKDAATLTRLARLYDHLKRFKRMVDAEQFRGPLSWAGTILGGRFGLPIGQASLQAQWELVAGEIAAAVHGAGIAPVTTTEDFKRLVNVNTMSGDVIKKALNDIADGYIKPAAEELHTQFRVGTGWPQEEVERRFNTIVSQELTPRQVKELGINQEDIDQTANRFNELTGRKGPIQGQGAYSGWTATPVN